MERGVYGAHAKCPHREGCGLSVPTMETQSMERCIKRCSVYYEELMSLMWHPDRVIQLRDRGYKPSDI
jgi:hypothetical protein